jgi:hypothetical protein
MCLTEASLKLLPLYPKMKLLKTLALTSFLVIPDLEIFAQEIWTIGPMLHVNFGGEKRSTSFGIEAAYWNIKKTPYSFDFGIEFDRRKTRLYTEAQTGIGITGVSLGPVVQFNTGGRTKLGIQGSCWINYILGVDYRMRFLRDEKIHSVGTYVKVLMASSGLPSGSKHRSHWSDWDD